MATGVGEFRSLSRLIGSSFLFQRFACSCQALILATQQSGHSTPTTPRSCRLAKSWKQPRAKERCQPLSSGPFQNSLQIWSEVGSWRVVLAAEAFAQLPFCPHSQQLPVSLENAVHRPRLTTWQNRPIHVLPPSSWCCSGTLVHRHGRRAFRHLPGLPLDVEALPEEPVEREDSAASCVAEQLRADAAPMRKRKREREQQHSAILSRSVGDWSR